MTCVGGLTSSWWAGCYTAAGLPRYARNDKAGWFGGLGMIL